MMRVELTASGTMARALPLSYTRYIRHFRTTAYAGSETQRTREELTSRTR